MDGSPRDPQAYPRLRRLMFRRYGAVDPGPRSVRPTDSGTSALGGIGTTNAPVRFGLLRLRPEQHRLSTQGVSSPGSDNRARCRCELPRTVCAVVDLPILIHHATCSSYRRRPSQRMPRLIHAARVIRTHTGAPRTRMKRKSLRALAFRHGGDIEHLRPDFRGSCSALLACLATVPADLGSDYQGGRCSASPGTYRGVTDVTDVANGPLVAGSLSTPGTGRLGLRGSRTAHRSMPTVRCASPRSRAGIAK